MSSLAHAGVPNILGRFTGSGTDTESGCIFGPPTDSGSFTLDFTIDSQQGGAFSGKGSTKFDDGDVDSLTLSNGSIQASGAVSGNWKTVEAQGDQSAGTFSGQLNGDKLSVSFNGADIGGAMCNISGSFTSTRNTINPATSAGTAAVTPTVFFATAARPARLASTRIRSALKSLLAGGPANGAVPVADGFMLQGGTGISAGDDFSFPWGAWISYSHSDYSDDFVSTAFDADRDNVSAGIDFSPFERIVAGVSFGYDNNDIDTAFNRGNVDSDAFTVAPYIGALIDDTFGVDFSIGYSLIEIDQFRTLAGTRITSNVDSSRWFVAGNLNAAKAYGNWYLSGRAGLLYAKEEQDAFLESDGTANRARSFELGQLRIGGDAAYAWDAFEPFVSAVYELDYSRNDIVVGPGIAQPANDDDDFLVGAGLRWFGDSGLSASFEWNSVLGREDFDDNTYTFLIRADF